MVKRLGLIVAIAGVGFGVDGFVKVSPEIQHFSSSSKRIQEVKTLKTEAGVLLNNYGLGVKVGVKTADYDEHERVRDAWVTQYGIEVSKFLNSMTMTTVGIRVGIAKSNIEDADNGFWIGIRGQTLIRGIEVKGDLVYYKHSENHSGYEYEGKLGIVKKINGFEISPQLRLIYYDEKTKPFVELKVAKEFGTFKGIIKPYIKAGIGDAKKTSDGMFVYSNGQIYKSVVGAGLSWTYKRVSLNLFGEYQRVRDIDVDQSISTSIQTGKVTIVHGTYGGTFVGGSIKISF